MTLWYTTKVFPLWETQRAVLSQSVIEAAFDAQLTINLTEEFEKALKNYRAVALNIKWKEFLEVKLCLKDEMFPPTHILTWREKWVIEMGHVLKTYFIKKDPDRALFGYIPIMTTACKGSIGALLSARFRERINICINQIVSADNTSLGDDLVDETIVLRIKKTS